MRPSEIVNKDELIAILATLRCQCGYVVTDEDECFEIRGNVTVFVCPRCDTEWTAEPIQVN